MKNDVSEWAESHFPLYTAFGVQSLYGSSNLPVHKINESLTVLIAIASGEGSLWIDDQTYDLAEGSVLLLPARTHAALITSRLQPLHAYTLLISAREQTIPQFPDAMMRRSDIASRQDVLFIPYEPAIVAKVEELYFHRSPAHEARHVQNQIVFHQIIFQVLEQQDAKYGSSEQPSMERSIAYLENHYSDKISREQLAAVAGISRSHYSTLFKQLTGFSPSEYLTRLRVHRAMELLISGSGTLREIALKVGYKDEFYLSRRFKQQTGASPSGYNAMSLQRVAVLRSPYASHLRLLGLEPVVAIAESSEYVNTSDLQKPQSMVFLNIDSSVEQIKSALLESRTELIIAARRHLQMMGLTISQLRPVAPVVEISWMEIGWKEHLRLIARAVQRSERAEQWLTVFEHEEQAARLLVQQSAVAKEIVTILVFKPEEMLVYGARNVGYVMYQSLGLQPPALIRKEMEQLGDQFHSIPIALAELAHYAGDRLLVIVYPDAKGSTAHAERIFESPDWSDLPAVQHDRVHLLDLDEWVPYNPVSIRLQVQRAVALFT
ncbi:helix-turn-helix domain-containing protein [Paenibacillaceae bacterium]|nr:helix-turn-helix domain-containing protein [Paenibacillaceae bacterium]